MTGREFGPGSDSVPEPAPIPVQESPRSRRLSRRAVVKGLGWLGLAGFTGAVGGGVAAVGNQLLAEARTVEVTQPPEYGLQFKAPFNGPNANLAAESLGITAGSFFVPTTETPELELIRGRIAETPDNFLTKRELLPLFPPTVHENAGLIHRLVNDVPETRFQVTERRPEGEVTVEHNIPANIVGIVATMESAGLTDADSGVGAIGPMQVKYDAHIDEIAFVADLVKRDVGLPPERVAEWKARVDANDRTGADELIGEWGIKTDLEDALKDPFVGYMVGIRILKKYHEQSVAKEREFDRNIDPNHPRIWLKTLAAYNEGPDGLDKSFVDLPTETQRYVLMANRFFMTAAIASNVREAGVGHAATADQLISTEINARAFALNRVKKSWPYETRSRLQSPLTVANIEDASLPEDIVEDLREAYLQYMDAAKRGEDLYPSGLPISAGLRLMLVEMGEAQLFRNDKNKDPIQYEANKG